MSMRLSFHRLELQTRSGTSVYEFQPGLNLVTGDYATGKSSMFELIKFGLGHRRPDLMPEIRRNLVSVRLDLTVGDHRIRTTRLLGRNVVNVASAGLVDETWTATQGKLPRAGIRLLELGQFPISRLRRHSGPTSEPLTFFDLYRYVYLPQANVNSSIAGHADTMVDRKRRAIFEIAYGLVDPDIHELEVRIENLKRSRDESSRNSKAVRDFMASTGTPDDEDLDGQEAVARQQLADAVRQLDRARELGITALPSDQEPLRARLSNLRNAAADLQSEIQMIQISIEKGRGLVAQLELDESAESRSLTARGSLSGLEFSACPRCLQSVQDRHVAVGHCLLCDQLQPIDTSATEHAADIERIRAQRTEAQSLMADDERRLARISAELDEIRVELASAASELEQAADPARLLPSLDMGTEAAGRREHARARLRDIERYRDLWFQYRSMIESIARTEREIEQCNSEVNDRRAALASHRERIIELSSVYDQEIRGLNFTGYQDAWIDEKTFLPVINGDTFEQLSVSGARKTLANVSYYLANLAMALNDSEITMPSTVILDSPRTSLGNTATDKAAGWRVYYRMHLLALASSECQIIVADNGLPEIPHSEANMWQEFRRRTNVIELTYESPLLKGVPHPGREHVETVGGNPDGAS